MSFAPHAGTSRLRHTLWTLSQILRTALVTLVWQTLREGMINLRPLARVLRTLTVVGLALILVFLASLLFNEVLRVTGTLEALTVESTSTRGLLVPSVAVPLTLVATTLAWGYVLTGALHTRLWVRGIILAVYVLFGFLPLATGLLPDVTGAASTLTSWLALAVIAALVAAWLVLSRWRLPLALEWALMLGLHGALVMLNMFVSIQQQLASDGVLKLSGRITDLTQTSFFLIAPFLFVAGLGWADFGLVVSGWAARAVRRHAATGVTTGLLAAFLGVRLLSFVNQLWQAGIDERQWGAWAGAALFLAGLIPIALWQRRRPAGDMPRQPIVLLIVLILLSHILLTVVLQVASLFVYLDPLNVAATTAFDRVIDSLNRWSTLISRNQSLVLAALGVGLAVLAARRQQAALAGYGVILAWQQVLDWLTQSGHWLYGVRYTHAEVEALVLGGLAALAGYWLIRRQLDQLRAIRLLALGVLMAVLNQTSFLDNPFSPFFEFAGVAFLVFSILWSVLTSGGQFANNSSASFPRTGRILLYLGYVLLSVSIAHWYLVSHNLESQATQAALNFAGFHVFGLPLAYLALVRGGHTLAAPDPAP